MAYFLAKTDPETYSIDDLEREKKTVWDGVTNPQAVRAIREMRAGDRVSVSQRRGCGDRRDGDGAIGGAGGPPESEISGGGFRVRGEAGSADDPRRDQAIKKVRGLGAREAGKIVDDGGTREVRRMDAGALPTCEDLAVGVSSGLLTRVFRLLLLTPIRDVK